MTPTLRAESRHIDIFFGFFKNNLERIKADPESVEQLFAEYVRDNMVDPQLSDFEKGYIAGASFMGVLESFQKTMEMMKGKTL